MTTEQYRNLSESKHAELLANWLRARNYTFHHSPNETWTKSWKQKRKNTLEGVSKGFPDYLIVTKSGSLLFIELKKARGKQGGLNGSHISEEQKQWIHTFESIDNVGAFFVHGWEEAVRIIEECENL